MKNFFLAFLLFSGISLSAQEVDVDLDIDMPTDNVWEVKGNAFYLVLGAVEVAIEHSLNSESAIGVAGFLPFDDDVKESIEYYISPYYRLYFGNKYAAGFFIEGFGMLNSTERTRFDFDIDPQLEEEFVTDFALGVGLGGKWVTKSGFVGEIHFGIGRNLFNTEANDVEVVGKGGISVGYRF